MSSYIRRSSHISHFVMAAAPIILPDVALPLFVDPPLTPDEAEEWHGIEKNVIGMMRNLLPSMEDRVIGVRVGLFLEFVTANHQPWVKRLNKSHLPNRDLPTPLNLSAIAAALHFGTPLRALGEAMRTTYMARVPNGEGGWTNESFEYTAHLPYLLSRIPTPLWRAMFAVSPWAHLSPRDAPPITTKNKNDARNYMKSKRNTILTLSRITEHLSKRTCKDTALLVLDFVSWRR